MKTYRKITLIIISIITLFTYNACQKFNQDVPSNTEADFTDLNISPDFKFTSNEKITLNLSVTPSIQDEAPHIFKVFNADPERGGKLISQGMTDELYNYNVTFTLPEYKDSIFVENSNANGIYELVGIKVTSNTINRSFNTYQLLNGKVSSLKRAYADPNCGNDCDEAISGTYGSLELDKLDFCVPEGSTLTVNGELKFKRNATIVICGTVNLGNIANINNRGKIYVSKTGSLNFSYGLNLPSKIEIYNWGTLTSFGNTITDETAQFYNFGLANVTGSMINRTNKFQNEGTLNVTGNFINESNNQGSNYGTINVNGNAMFQSNSIFYNYCRLSVTGNITLDKHLRNEGYVEVDGNFVINGSGKYETYTGSLAKTTNLVCNGMIHGNGQGYSKIEISNQTILNSGANIVNKIDLCDANGIETNNANIHPNVVYCETTIPESNCNPGSGGNTGTDDTDGDGVPDVDDQYPEDPDRAFDNYYPNQEDYSTFVFEDLWPGLGDYDFNDLVLDFQYHIVTNANNKIVDIIAKSHVKAAGATLNNGFGISFPTNSANCQSVSGYTHALNNLNINAAGYENGHNGETVAIFYDAINTIYNSSIFNTYEDRPYIETDTITVTTTFSNPEMSLGNEPYNPFIYVDQERGKEIHLIDNEPTDLVTASYFGTLHDNSIPASGRYYVTENNLPWAVEIPDSFDYPIEKAQIVNTYLKFREWAVSSGTLYPDWYLDKPGYREVDNIYERPE